MAKDIIDRDGLEEELSMLESAYIDNWNDEVVTELVENIFDDVRAAIQRNEKEIKLENEEGNAADEKEGEISAQSGSRNSSSGLSLLELSRSSYIAFSFGVMAGFGVGYGIIDALFAMWNINQVALFGVDWITTASRIIISLVLALMSGITAMVVWNKIRRGKKNGRGDE